MVISAMHLRILLPYEVYLDQENVLSMTAETTDGSVGLLPHRLDCVAALIPGIMSYRCEAETEAYIAVDAGILVKTGQQIWVSARNAKGGMQLDQLYDAVKDYFLELDESEREVRSTLAKLESGFVRRLAGLQ